MWEVIRRTKDQGWPQAKKKKKPRDWACGVAQVIEYLPSKHEAEFKPHFHQKKKKGKNK
jgi:hypothetical protein